MIRVGKTDGQYFTQWRLDFLRDLVPDIERQLGPLDFLLYYDSYSDFHHLHFTYRNKAVSVRFYIRLSGNIITIEEGKIINRQEHWVGCPSYQSFEWINSLCRKLKTGATQ